MSELRVPDKREGLGETGKRSARLRELVDRVVVGNDDISLIYWSQEDGGRWVAWEDPDALAEAGVTVAS